MMNRRELLAQLPTALSPAALLAARQADDDLAANTADGLGGEMYEPPVKHPAAMQCILSLYDWLDAALTFRTDHDVADPEGNCDCGFCCDLCHQTYLVESLLLANLEGQIYPSPALRHREKLHERHMQAARLRLKAARS